MIEKGHVHDLKPVSTFPRPDGSRVVQLRCQAVVATLANELPCALEQELVFLGDEVTSIRFRFSGMWFSALDLLRLAPLGVIECPECEGVPMLLPCETCNGLGVVDEATREKLAMPNLRVPVG